MSAHSFDPEVVALLREVAADPRASLLHVPKERLIRWVGRPEELVSPTGSHLTKAEKHLVSAYREEAAWVLLQACVAELKKLPLVFSNLDPKPESLADAAKHLTEVEHLDPDTRKDISRVADGTADDVVQLAAAALRLAPNDHARNCLAVAFQAKGLEASSMRQIRVLLAGEPCAAQKAQAYENMAQVWSKREDHQRALACNSRASKADESKVRLLVWCLTSALQVGDARCARAYSLQIQEHPGKDGVVDISAALLSARSLSDWRPTARSQELVRGLEGKVPDVAWSVCNAFS